MAERKSQRQYGGLPPNVALVALTALTLGGCASVPDVTVAYQPVTWSVGASVVQTITCSRDAQQAIIARGATFTPIYQADKEAEPLTLPLKALNRFFADSELTVGFTEDGRLKSINQSATGQGETITKALVGAVVSVGSAGAAKGVAALPGFMSNLSKNPMGGERLFSLRNGELRLEEGPSLPPSKLCKVVMEWSSVDTTKGGFPQISVIQTASIGPQQLPMGEVPIARADAQSANLIAALNKAGFDTSARLQFRLPVPPKKSGSQPVGETKFEHDEVALKIQETSTLTLGAVRQEGRDTVAISSGSINVPLEKSYVKLPIPRPALFGKQSFQLQLGESGRIATLGYARTAGAAGALNAISSVASEQTAQDSADAAALKAAADLIVQQNRLSNCLMSKDECK